MDCASKDTGQKVSHQHFQRIDHQLNCKNPSRGLRGSRRQSTARPFERDRPQSTPTLVVKPQLLRGPARTAVNKSLLERGGDLEFLDVLLFIPPSVGGLDLNSSNRGCARLGGEVDPPLGVAVEEYGVSSLIPAIWWTLLPAWPYRRGRRDFKHFHCHQQIIMVDFFFYQV